ncbi:LysR family transcriptional regulator [Stappia sp. ES.058]|uniref:LysR family transcriptional regulator n=1 Tax=Stappia sp. ES.058 TaxID=1881061 RepID=UPI00087C2B9A|nr:LysR family transcriptional regulator [Stappia sp. ES.058]SDU09601.1 DNA-binding transcriptional regulator, LysR family [Stappia sp. ES.058]
MDKSRHLYGPALRYFAAVARAGSIRAAARELNIASSAVNRQVLWLERALGHVLFDRLARGVRLTPAGEILRAHVLRTLSDFSATAGELDALTGMRSGAVSIASVESVSEALLPAVVMEFRKLYPGIHVSVRISGSDEVAEAVIAGQTDVGFSFEPPEDPRLNGVFRRDLAIGAVMAPGHPLAKRHPLHLAECLAHPFCLPTRDLSLRKLIDAALPADALAGRAFVEANSLRMMKRLAAAGEAIAFQTIIGLEREMGQGELVFLPLADPALSRDRFTVLTSSHRGLSHAAQAFFEHSVSAVGDRLSQIDADTAS